jgi:hypothetical protein
MLSDDQKRRLETRGELSPEERKINEFAIRKNLRKWLNGAEDFVFVSDTLPMKQLEKIITNQDFTKLAKATIKLLHVLSTPHILDGKQTTAGIIPIDEKTDLPTQPGPIRGFKRTLREATPEELERAELIKDHIKELFICLGESDLIDLRDEIDSTVEG